MIATLGGAVTEETGPQRCHRYRGLWQHEQACLEHCARTIRRYLAKAKQPNGKRMTHEYLAHAVGVTRKMITNFLGGQSWMRTGRILHIAEILQIPHDELFGPGLGIPPHLWPLVVMLKEVDPKMLHAIEASVSAYLTMESRLETPASPGHEQCA